MNKDRIKEKITHYYHSRDDYYDKLDVVFSERSDRAVKIGSFDIMSYAKHASTILDVGCGTGTLLRHIKIQYPEKMCYGVDLSPIAIQKAEKKSGEAGTDITFAVADMEKTCPFPENHFDLIVAHEVLEHFVHPDLLINNIATLLKNGGIVMIIAPNHFIRASFTVKARKMVDFFRMVFDKRYLNPTIIDPPLDVVGGDSDAVYVSNPWELRRMVGNAGLTVIKKSNIKCRLVARK